MRVVGALLMLAGAAWIVLCAGVVTAFFLTGGGVGMRAGAGGSADDGPVTVIALIAGVLAAAPGLGVFFLGRAFRR